MRACLALWRGKFGFTRKLCKAYGRTIFAVGLPGRSRANVP